MCSICASLNFRTMQVRQTIGTAMLQWMNHELVCGIYKRERLPNSEFSHRRPQPDELALLEPLLVTPQVVASCLPHTNRAACVTNTAGAGGFKAGWVCRDGACAMQR
jgi:hypothetical protein